MKSRTSFFKPITLRKDIFRYAPLWALYLIVMMMVLITEGSNAFYDYNARRVDDMIIAFGVVNIAYAGAVAAMLFGDLYNTKLCYSLHAMPVRRESWLLTHFVAGLLFSLVPNLVATAYFMFELEAYWFLGLYWLLAVTLQYLFFFGLASVSALLTGSRFAMLAVYAGFNFVAMLVYATVQTIYLPLLEGVQLTMDRFSRFSPVVRLFNYKYFAFEATMIPMKEAWGEGERTFYQFTGLADGWGYLTIIALVGVAAMGISLWLYRIRSLESAGDFVAFPRLKGISCVIITLCVTLAAALVGEAFSGEYLPWMIVGVVIGFFGSLMLLERRVKVFRKKTLLGFVAFAIVFGLTMVAAAADWLGVESWCPQPDRVASVTVSNQRSSYSYYDGGTMKTTLTDPEDIAQIVQAHGQILEELEKPSNSRYFVALTYQMKSGRIVQRYYSPSTNGEHFATVQRYLYKPDNVLGFRKWQDVVDRLEYMYTGFGEVPLALRGALLQALQEECENGYVTPVNDSKYTAYVEYAFHDKDGVMVYRALGVMSEAKAVQDLLRSPEMMLGYATWTGFPEKVENFYCNNVPIRDEEKAELLEALRQDVLEGTLEPGEYHTGGVELFYTVRQNNRTNLKVSYMVDHRNKNTWAWLELNGYLS